MFAQMHRPYIFHDQPIIQLLHFVAGLSFVADVAAILKVWKRHITWADFATSDPVPSWLAASTFVFRPGAVSTCIDIARAVYLAITVPFRAPQIRMLVKRGQGPHNVRYAQ